MVSVVMVATPGDPRLVQSLTAVLAQSFLREVIVVLTEPCTTFEATLEKLSQDRPRCYVVKGKPVSGLADAYNLGAQYASGEYLLFLGPSCVLPENGMDTLLTIGARKTMPWVVGMQFGIAPLKSRPRADRFKKQWEKLVNRMTKFSVYDEHKNSGLIEVSLPGGGLHASVVPPDCLFMSTKVFAELKGFDKHCFHSTFHLDLCLRVHLLGGGVYQAKPLTMSHQSNPSVGLWKTIRQTWRGFYGWCHFYRKHVSRKSNIIMSSAFYGIFGLRFLGSICYRSVSYLFERPEKALLLPKERNIAKPSLANRAT
jgi:GT2 family glycosyltransferase